MMKRIGMLLVLCTCILSLLSCKDKENTEDANRYSKVQRNKACCEDGLFYQGDDSLIHFVSAETKEDMIFCFNPVCEHEPASEANKDPECMAAGCYPISFISYHDGNIYLFVDESIDKHTIYRMDINSGIREFVAELPFNTKARVVVFNNDCVYYIARTYIPIEGTWNSEVYLDLIEVNLDDGSYRMLTDMKGVSDFSNFSDFNVCDNKMFVVLSFSDNIRKLCYMDLDTLEFIIDTEGDDFLNQRYIGVYDSESYYYTNENEVGIHNITTGENQILLKPQLEEGTRIVSILAGSNKVYYKVNKNTAEGYEYFLYNIDDNKTWNLTEKLGNYIVDSYDPYKEMFILRLDNEDGTTDYSVMRVSELIGE